MLGRIATYGLANGPNTSVTVPTGLRFSSMAWLPMCGTLSALRIMLPFELMWITQPILCKPELSPLLGKTCQNFQMERFI